MREWLKSIILIWDPVILFIGLDLLKDSTAALPANVTVNNFDKETYCFGFNQEKVVSFPKWPELETLEKEVLENAKNVGWIQITVNNSEFVHLLDS